jgi:hypothetical protein
VVNQVPQVAVFHQEKIILKKGMEACPGFAATIGIGGG